MKRKHVFCVLSALVLLLFVFSLFGCLEREPEPNNRVFYDYFDTVCVLYDYTGMESEDFESLSRSVEAAISHYHRLFDAYHEYADTVNIATLNKLAGSGEVKVDRAIIDLLLFSAEMYEKTDGSVNFAMGAVTMLWKSAAAEKRVPTEAELLAAGAHISPSSVIINKERGTVEILDSASKIDVGAIAKGYTAERIKEELSLSGNSGIILDMGGNLCAIGERPGGKGWESGIRNPLYLEGAEEPYVRTVTLRDGSLVTSGVYERYYTVNGKKYHHIVDPVTLMPEYRYLSVTVLASDSGVADALSTAIFNMEEERAKAFVSSFDEEIEVTLVFPDGNHTVIKN